MVKALQGARLNGRDRNWRWFRRGPGQILTLKIRLLFGGLTTGSVKETVAPSTHAQMERFFISPGPARREVSTVHYQLPQVANPHDVLVEGIGSTAFYPQTGGIPGSPQVEVGEF